jgi:hypothetical protein
MFNHHNSPFALPFASKGEKYEREREREKDDKMAWAHHGIQHKALELHPVSDDMA